MARLPLVLSAHSPVRTTGVDKGGREEGRFSCHFCTLDAGRAPDKLVVTEAGEAPVSVIACPLCGLAHRLGDHAIDQDAVVIWLPETTQAALNLLVRHIHLVCATHGDSSRFADVARPAASDRVRAARLSYLTLHERTAAAMSRLGTASPALLGDALLELGSADYDRRHDLLSGARLLSTGQLHRGGEDVYPGLLQSWLALNAPTEKAKP